MSDASTVPASEEESAGARQRKEERRNVLADLILVVTKGTVERGEFTKLVALVIVLTLGNGGGLRRERIEVSERQGRGISEWSNSQSR